MSADNWTTCPRCLAEARAAAAQERERVMAAYGTVSVEEFDAMRAALKDVNEDDFQTFREDYEFYGADEGEIHASYSGQCSACGLDTSLNASEKFYP